MSDIIVSNIEIKYPDGRTVLMRPDGWADGLKDPIQIPFENLDTVTAEPNGFERWMVAGLDSEGDIVLQQYQGF